MKQYLDEFNGLKRRNLFNTETVNFFTDASFRTKASNFAGAAYGSIMVYQNDIIENDIKWHQAEGESINSLELKAIRNAVGKAFSVQYILHSKGIDVPISYINIFSDSHYSVTAIKGYLFSPDKWVWNYSTRCYTKSTNYNMIPNQDLIIEISNMILKFQALNPNIVFDMWWCPAHVKLQNKKITNKQLKKAAQRFKEVNCKEEKFMYIDNDFMRYVCESNDKIDAKVKRKSKNYNEKNRVIRDPIKFYYGP